MGLGRILTDILILAVVATTIWYVYDNYSDQIVTFLYGEQPETMYINNLPLSISVADTDAERKQGLSEVSELGELQGKLFIFDTSGDYGIWMKDMLIPIDIIWINEQYQIVDIAENVTPDTYPRVFHSRAPARFVLEVNAFFTKSFGVEVGDQVTIPASLLPLDLRNRLLNDVQADAEELQF